MPENMPILQSHFEKNFLRAKTKNYSNVPRVGKIWYGCLKTEILANAKLS